MSWLDKNQNKILLFIWSSIFLTCFFIIFTDFVNAESPSGSLPYVVSNNWDSNSAMHNNFDVCLNWARQRFENVDHVPEGYSILVWTYNGAWADGFGRIWTSYVYCVNPYITDYYSSNFDYTLNTVTIHSDYPIYTYNYCDPGTYNSGAGSGTANLLGTYSLVGTEYALYTPNYPFYYDGDPILDPNGLEVIVNTYSPPIDSSGHATPPINDTGHYIPNVNPQHPTIIFYNPSSPNFPAIDTSSLENLIESLIDITKYGFNYLAGVISGFSSNLLSNLDNLFDYVIQSFYKGFNNIVGAIQDLATDFYNNMVSLFEPVSSAINYISEPISGTVIYDNLSNTGIITNYNSIVTTVTGFQDGFTNLSEPNEFKIPIHLENLPSSMFGTLTTQYIDLSVINPVKSIIRAFLWALVTYSLFVTIIDSIANYINGGGDE